MKIENLLLEQAVLIEHLGNLDIVDKELLKPLVANFASHRQTVGGMRWKDDGEEHSFVAKPGDFGSAHSHKNMRDEGEARQTPMIQATLGRGSSVDEKTLPWAKVLEEFMTNEDYPAVIIKIEGKQALVLAHDKALGGKRKLAGYKETNQYTWQFTKAFLRTYSGEIFPKGMTLNDELIKALKVSSLQAFGKISVDSRVRELVKVMAMLTWVLSLVTLDQPGVEKLPTDSKLPPLDVLLISKDTERVTKHVERKQARSNNVPLPSTPSRVRIPGASYNASVHNVYVAKLKSSLKYRLNAYKGSKAIKFDSVDDMFKHIVTEGYLDKITFMDSIYALDEKSIDTSDLFSKKSTGKSYISYKNEKPISWSDPELDLVNAELKALKNQLKQEAPPPSAAWLDGATDDEAREKLHANWVSAWAYEKLKPKTSEIYLKYKIPPTKLMIHLVLEGGRIVPHEIKMSFSDF